MGDDLRSVYNSKTTSSESSHKKAREDECVATSHQANLQTDPAGGLSDCSESSWSTEDSCGTGRSHPHGSRKRKGSPPGSSSATVVLPTASSQIPRQRMAANARERDRTHSVNTAFVTLRTLIPTEPADRKLSKIETLRLATSYIAHLNTVLMVGSDCIDQPCIKHQAMIRGHDMPKPVCTFCLSASRNRTPWKYNSPDTKRTHFTYESSYHVQPRMIAERTAGKVMM